MKRIAALNWKYALGELLIVFVGILAAVQVDRWNTARQERVVLMAYLERIVSDLEADEAMLAWITEVATDQAEAADRLLAMLTDGGVVPPDSVVRAAIIPVLTGRIPVSIRSGTFRDMVNTGSLALITDGELRSALIDYYEVSVAPPLSTILDYTDREYLTPMDGLLARHLDPRVLLQTPPVTDSRPLFVTGWERLRGDDDVLSQLRRISAGAAAVTAYYPTLAEASRGLRDHVTAAY